MSFNRKRKAEVEIPTASMSDISFLLLVFFLSTTTFDIKKGLGLVLPAASNEEAQKVKLKQENLTKVLVTATGAILINEEEVSLDTLEDRIQKSVRDNPDMVISLKTDRDAKYDNMIVVLDRIQRAGAEKISLSTN
jgi:biopolymer transport protein ExbD